MRHGKLPRYLYKKYHTRHRIAGDTNGHSEGVTTGRKSRGLGNGLLKISVEGIQERIVGSSISPIRLEKRLPLPSMPAH